MDNALRIKRKVPLNRGVFYCCVAFFGVLLAVWVWFAHTQGLTFRSIDTINLKGVYSQWNEQGRPIGADFTNFMAGRRGFLLVLGTTLVCGGTNYVELVALTNAHGGGTLFITTNGVLIRIEKEGEPKISR